MNDFTLKPKAQEGLVICVPASDTFHLIESLNIYCRQVTMRPTKAVELLIPRISIANPVCRGFLENSGYSLKNIPSEAGVCWSVYIVKGVYMVNPQTKQYEKVDITRNYAYTGLAAAGDLDKKITIWKKRDIKREPRDRKTYLVFELEKELIFNQLKYTTKRNFPNKPYYVISNIIGSKTLECKPIEDDTKPKKKAGRPKKSLQTI